MQSPKSSSSSSTPSLFIISRPLYHIIKQLLPEQSQIVSIQFQSIASYFPNSCMVTVIDVAVNHGSCSLVIWGVTGSEHFHFLLFCFSNSSGIKIKNEARNKIDPFTYRSMLYLTCISDVFRLHVCHTNLQMTHATFSQAHSQAFAETCFRLHEHKL